MNNSSSPALTLGRSDYRSILIALAAANVVLVLIMAILGGRFFVSPSIIDIHGYLGNFVFLMFVGQAVVLYLSKPGGPLGKALLVLSVLAVVMVIGQIGLGYSSRTSVDALTFHIPLGVLIFGVSAAILAQLPYATSRQP